MRRVVHSVLAAMAASAPVAAEDLGYFVETRIVAPVIVRESEARRQGPPPLLVALHGRGGNAQEFSSLWDALDEPRPLLAVPQGPYPVLITGATPTVGWSWFVLSRDRDLWKRADPLAVEQVLRVVSDLQQARPVGPVFLLGFSQGVSLAYMAAFAAPERVAGVIAFAGRLPLDSVSETALRAAAPTLRVFIAHGAEDPTVTPAESRNARDRLATLGFAVEYREFPGGHRLAAEPLRAAIGWLAAPAAKKQ